MQTLQRRIRLRKLSLLAALAVSLTLAVSSQSQEFHGAFGFGTVVAPSASTNSSGFTFPSLSGGLYPSFSGTVLTKRHIGFGGEVSWRASRALYGGTTAGFGIVQPYRPIFYDFNAVYGSTFQKKVGVDVMAGIGAESLRFYTPYVTCGFTSCTNYQSSNHFAGHFGGDIRFYFWGHAFIRPEAHYYVIRNNVEFNNSNAARFAVSIGYSFMPGF
jgi:hypothetical protein